VGVVAFLVTLCATPIVRRLAVANGIIDRPSDPRKIHRMPIAYLGGVAVFLGIVAGIFYSYFGLRFEGLVNFHKTSYLFEGYMPFPVPVWILVGLTVITLVGLWDDVHGVSPRVKLGGQLIAAAALAYGEVGTNVARGVLAPTLGALLHNRDLTWTFDLPVNLPLLGATVELDMVYWCGVGVIAVFILGATNAANLIDGLDGLLSGVTAIATIGFLLIALSLAVADDGVFDAPRIVLCLAVLGACLGFLPHNFNPATIFLGDTGSLLLGYCAAVMILSLGDTGKTYLVVAGLIIYAIPITDTVLAIVRRKLAGKKMSDPDSDHLHHMLKRAAGVKGAVLILYGFGTAFATLGFLISETRARFIYALTLLFAAYIGVYAIKIARRKQIEEQAAAFDAKAASRAAAPSRAEPRPEPVGIGQ
jgi:UDP-GlcNAc:undecaprenyl-phosphate GlcNAc-1-phosphate transferase